MLKSPKTEKQSLDAETEWLRFGKSCMQGWRWYMEDACTVVADLVPSRGISFVGVYDGHTTSRAAHLCAQAMHEQVARELKSNKQEEEDVNQALQSSFVKVDQDYRGTLANPDDPDCLIRAGGTTACVVVLSQHAKRVTVANVGDSRCVLARKGRAVELSRDHKVDEREDERVRIEAAGGKVGPFGRLGNLNLTRAIGDFNLKLPCDAPPEKQQLTAVPEMTQTDVAVGKDDFLVVASDGVWECRSSQEVIDFVSQRITQDGQVPLSRVCEELIDACVKKQNPKDKDEPGTADNITIVIVAFKPGHIKN